MRPPWSEHTARARLRRFSVPLFAKKPKLAERQAFLQKLEQIISRTCGIAELRRIYPRASIIAMPINTATTLKDIVLSHAAAARVLESYHLDYYCGGEQTLVEACRKANLDPEAVVAALTQAHGPSQLDPCEQECTLTEQAGFILGRHHAFTHAKLPPIEALLARIIERHGAAQPKLEAVEDCFGELQATLDAHMLREEQSLLPRIEALDKRRRGEMPLPPGSFDTIEDLLRQSKDEHQKIGNLLKKLRELTSDFAPPADASSTYRTAYQALEELETDLMHHIHLENNVLFPRVQEVSGKF